MCEENGKKGIAKSTDEMESEEMKSKVNPSKKKICDKLFIHP